MDDGGDMSLTLDAPVRSDNSAAHISPMRTFLWFAAKAGFTADSYEDEAVGVMSKNERGSMWVSAVTLRPRIAWSGEKIPTAADLDRLHHRAHEECFIANSIRTTVKVESPGM